MTYDLGKRLKDAGFPPSMKHHDVHYPPNDGTPAGIDASIQGKVEMPCLEEIIDASGGNSEAMKNEFAKAWLLKHV